MDDSTSPPSFRLPAVVSPSSYSLSIYSEDMNTNGHVERSSPLTSQLHHRAQPRVSVDHVGALRTDLKRLSEDFTAKLTSLNDYTQINRVIAPDDAASSCNAQIGVRKGEHETRIDRTKSTKERASATGTDDLDAFKTRQRNSVTALPQVDVRTSSKEKKNRSRTISISSITSRFKLSRFRTNSSATANTTNSHSKKSDSSTTGDGNADDDSAHQLLSCPPNTVSQSNAHPRARSKTTTSTSFRTNSSHGISSSESRRISLARLFKSNAATLCDEIRRLEDENAQLRKDWYATYRELDLERFRAWELQCEISWIRYRSGRVL